MPQTLTEIRATLAAAGLHPQKRLGQNFLIDGNLMTKVCEAAGVTAECAVLEVGCGTGSLTDMLLDRAGWVVGVEIDRGLTACLQARLASRANCTLLNTDVLASKSRISPAVLQALSVQAAAGRELFLVANLPYSIASPLMMDLLTCGIEVRRYCVVIQKEVAERVLAAPGRREYGPMSIVLQACADIRRVAHLPATAFWPVPQVASLAIRLDFHKRPFGAPGTLQGFAWLVRAAFAHRRKTLNYNLRTLCGGHLETVLQDLGLDPRVRAEALPVETWLEMFARLGPHCGMSGGF